MFLKHIVARIKRIAVVHDNLHSPPPTTHHSNTRALLHNRNVGLIDALTNVLIHENLSLNSVNGSDLSFEY